MVFGCAIKREVAPVITGEALSRASFVGHDSSGIALIGDKTVEIYRGAKPVGDLLADLDLMGMRARACIGHLRWATHGAPYEANAHPLRGCQGILALAHNGIIENFSSLKEQLEASGHIFSSKTDSEVLVHLVEEKVRSSLSIPEAISAAIEEVEGSLAIVLLHAGEPDSVFCACRGSRLFVAEGEEGAFCSSELACLHGLAERYTRLGDGQVAILRPDGLEVLGEKAVEMEPFGFGLEEAKRNGFSHMLLREIWEQAECLANALRLQKPYLDQMARMLCDSEEIFLVGEGSSYNACLAASYIFSSIAYQAAHAVKLSEFLDHYGEALNVATTVLIVDELGDSPVLRDVMEVARKKGATVLGITNKLGTHLTYTSRVYVCQHSGPPLGVLPMRTFTAQTLVLLQLALRMAEMKGKIGHLEIEEFSDHLSATPSLVEETIRMALPKAEEVAKKYADRRFFFVLGRGVGYPTALEGVQKLMEVAKVAGLSYPAGESKHGPISLVEEGFPVIFICQRDETHDTIIGNIMEMKARGASVISVAEEGDEEVKELSDDLLPVPEEVPAFLTPVIYVIPLQLLAYYSALARGRDPDEKAKL